MSAPPVISLCLGCGRPRTDDHHFCPFCGYDHGQKPKMLRCGRCERIQLATGWVFCPHCGYELHEIQDAPEHPCEACGVLIHSSQKYCSTACAEEEITEAVVVNDDALPPPSRAHLTLAVRPEDCQCVCHLSNQPPDGWIGPIICEHCMMGLAG